MGKFLLHCVQSFSHVWLFVTTWTIALQAPLSMWFSGKNIGMYCHALLHGIFPTQGWSLHLMSPAVAGKFFTTVPPGKPYTTRVWLKWPWGSVQFSSLQLSVCLAASVLSNSATPWTVAHQVPLSMGFFRQEYWSGVSFPFSGIFPTQGLN